MDDQRDNPPQRSTARSADKIPLTKKLLFSAVTTAIILAAVEIILTVAGVKPLFFEDPFLGFAAGNPLFQEVQQPDGSIVYSTSPNKLSFFNDQSFARTKEPESCRIFCLGGSTTVGRPYDDKTSFAGWLREFTAAADLNRKYEVINAGGISYASYRIARLMNELVEYEPDIFIVYTGHNEFLENQTYGSIREIPDSVRNTASQLSHTRIYSAIHRLLNSPSQSDIVQPSNNSAILPAEVRAVLDRTVGPESYHRDDKLQSQVISHFSNTLHRIIDIAEHVGAEIIFVEPASNLKDCHPFKSQFRSDLSEIDRKELQQFIDQSTKAADSGDLNAELRAYDKAIEIDDRVAQLHFDKARVLLRLDRFTEARAAFTRARDEDICPLRALSAIRTRIHDVTRERGVTLIPFAAEVDARSPNGIPGAELFLDHVHPTIQGHQLIAELLLDELINRQIIAPSPTWSDDSRNEVVERVTSGVDQHDHAVALRNLSNVLGWAGKYEEADRVALQAVEQLPDDPAAQFHAGLAETRRGNYEQAISYFERSLKLDPSNADACNNIGDAFFQLGDLENAAEYFKQAIQLTPGFAAAHSNLGVVHFQQGDLHQAETCLKIALQIEPDRVDSMLTLSNVYLKAGYPTEARKYLEQAVRLRPDDATARERLDLLMKSGP